jgi:hypothetical protein
MPLAVDLSELPNEVKAALHRVCTDDAAAQIVQARIRQRKIAKFYADNRPKAIDGFGPQTMAVDPFFIGYFNMQHKRKVCADPEFMKFIAKQDDSFRVRSGGTKVQSGYTGGGRRFSKAYDWKRG